MIPMNMKGDVLIDKNGRACLMGFGSASIVLRNQSPVCLDAGPMIATWAAPELSKGGSVTKAGDIFTFAMVAAEVCMEGVFERSFLTSSPQTDVCRAFPASRMLQCCVNWGAP